MRSKNPVVMIGLDAADASLIERYMAEGSLPSLRALRAKGCFGKLEADAHLFAGGVWPTFYTSKKVPWHGIYHNKLWRHEHMRCEIAGEAWLPETPFWEWLDNTRRMAIIDVPMTLGRPKPINGVHICGWGTHDLISKGTWPPELWQKLRRRYGAPAIPPEDFGPQTPATLLKLRRHLLRTNRQMVSMAEDLLEQEPWDLFLLVLGTAHRAGHYLWDLSQIDAADTPAHKTHLLDQALQEIYQDLDRAVGRIMRKAPPNAHLMVFAVHGMGRNPGWSDYCPEMLAMIQRAETGAAAKRGPLYRLRQALPWQLIRQVTRHMPQNLLERLVQLWSKDMFDWPHTPSFPLPMDHAGYIRINLKGREPQGIVAPGGPYKQVCRHLEDALLGFRDLDSGRPIVHKVMRMEQLAPASAPFFNHLPDLVVTWGDISAINSRGIYSDIHGKLLLNGRLPSGRAGNHTSEGWFIACGRGIEAGSRAARHSIVDLVPTVFSWMELDAPAQAQGKHISMPGGKP